MSTSEHNRPVDVMRVSWSGRTVTIGSATVAVEHPVIWAAALRDAAVVLFDTCSVSGSVGVFENLIGLDRAGTEIWRASVPTSQTGDCYVQASEESGQVVAWSWSGVRVRIDPASGELVARDLVR